MRKGRCWGERWVLLAFVRVVYWVGLESEVRMLMGLFERVVKNSDVAFPMCFLSPF